MERTSLSAQRIGTNGTPSASWLVRSLRHRVANRRQTHADDMATYRRVVAAASARLCRRHARAVISIAVAHRDTLRLRRALFGHLHNRIKQLVIVAESASTAPEPMARLQVVLEPDAVEEALSIVRVIANINGAHDVVAQIEQRVIRCS